MRSTFTIILLLICTNVIAQNNFLGKSQKHIEDFYRDKANYYLKIDTLSPENILLTFKSLFQYPYYTYEMDITVDVCISYGLVSKDKDVLGAYFDLLDFYGTIIRKDTVNHNVIFEVKQSNILRYYDIKQPYIEDDNINRRSLFYILVREKRLDFTDY